MPHSSSFGFHHRFFPCFWRGKLHQHLPPSEGDSLAIPLTCTKDPQRWTFSFFWNWLFWTFNLWFQKTCGIVLRSSLTEFAPNLSSCNSTILTIVAMALKPQFGLCWWSWELPSNQWLGQATMVSCLYFHCHCHCERSPSAHESPAEKLLQGKLREIGCHLTTWPVPHVSSKDHSAIHAEVSPRGHVAVWPVQLHNS